MTRILTVVEAALGRDVMGHGRFVAALREGLAGVPDVEAEFAGLPELAGLSRALTRGAPWLNARDLDLQGTRWHLVQSVRARRVLRDALREHPADVALILSHAVALLADRGAPVPVVPSVDVPIWMWREMAIWRPVRSYSRRMLAASLALERRTLSVAPLVHVWTGWAEAGVLASAPGARTFRAHPGLDVTRYRPAERAARPRPRVLFVGGRFAQKGGEDLIEALGPQLATDVELDVVTPAPLDPRPGLLVHRLQADDPELVALYQQADLLCLPTHGDAVPWVVLEAMACATPVVATGLGAIPELLDGGGAGVIVPVGDVAALRAAVTGLLDDPGRRAELGARGRALAEERYDARRQRAAILERVASVAG
jgi:glycosyltransferase involved in cell wall biosynthesis